ncbi:MBL fold metallo-hydrolase [Candidatus Pantoea formicae]|uniref:MBL fold metallo-hydrolase n=1 Tax=Candidatus Pantoea formicae TaxID=2608355 RepID=UPI003EDA7C9D
MNVTLTTSVYTSSLVEALKHPPPERGVSLFWLGQAGFVLRTAKHCIVIDPYLSDSLAEKYRGRPLPHQRMMAAPIRAETLSGVTHVLVTHHHSDHLDGATLTPMLAVSPDASLVLPRAATALAMERIPLLDCSRLISVNAGETHHLASDLTLHVVRASHETLEQDDAGNFRFLGYVIDIGGVRIFHSGDTIPFEGQVAELAKLNIDAALLPVNGRSESLRAQGVPGNMTAEEAVRLCAECNIRYMIAHHYGLFEFNTVNPAMLDAMAAKHTHPVLQRARLHTRYQLEPPTSAEKSE